MEPILTFLSEISNTKFIIISIILIFVIILFKKELSQKIPQIGSKTMVEHKPDKIVMASIIVLAILCIFVVLFIF
jgi:hypothetical protein